MASTKDQKRDEPTGNVKTYTASKPEFIKLKPGQSVAGVFIGLAPTRFGIAYKFRQDDGRIVRLGGNRVQLDTLFEELDSNPDFKGTVQGHYLEIARDANVQSSTGRPVAQYRALHHIDKCPGCKK